MLGIDFNLSVYGIYVPPPEATLLVLAWDEHRESLLDWEPQVSGGGSYLGSKVVLVMDSHFPIEQTRSEHSGSTSWTFHWFDCWFGSTSDMGAFRHNNHSLKERDPRTWNELENNLITWSKNQDDQSNNHLDFRSGNGDNAGEGGKDRKIRK